MRRRKGSWPDALRGNFDLDGRDMDGRIAANGWPRKAANRGGSAALKAASRLTADSSRVAHMTAHDASTLGESPEESRRRGLGGRVPRARAGASRIEPAPSHRGGEDAEQFVAHQPSREDATGSRQEPRRFAVM